MSALRKFPEKITGIENLVIGKDDCEEEDRSVSYSAALF